MNRDSQPEKPIERSGKLRIRFSLLTFLLIVFGTGTFIGVWVMMVEPIRVQWKAAEPLLELGVTFETVPSDMPGWMTAFLPDGQKDYIECVNFNRERITNECATAMTHFPRLERLYMERSGAKDDHCIEIAKITSLRRLAIWGTLVTDIGARHLATLPNLEIVDLTRTSISWRTDLLFQDLPEIILRSDYSGHIYEADISDIKYLVKLNVPVVSIELRNALDSDVELVIDSLPSLKSIDLSGNSLALTAEGLIKIRDCRRIESLSIGHYDEPDHPADAVPRIIRLVCELWGPRSRKASIVRHDQSYLTIWLFEDDEQRVISPEVRLGIRSERLRPKHLEGIPGLENVGTLALEGFDPKTLVVLGSMKNLNHLSMSNVVQIPDDYAGEIAQLDQLESFRVSARLRWNEFILPDDFFDDWQSRNSLRSILIHHADVTWPQLKPLLNFSKLERLMIESKNFTQNASFPRDFLPSLHKRFASDSK